MDVCTGFEKRMDLLLWVSRGENKQTMKAPDPANSTLTTDAATETRKAAGSGQGH